MKKLTLLVVFGLCVYAADAQYQRLVLFEEFTQASCGPCASQNPGFNALLDDNTDVATSIKYQVWWPGFDPMYLHNTVDVDNRVGYYGVSGVPHATMDGIDIVNDCAYYDAAPACVDQTDIDNAAAVTSPFFMELSHTMANDYSSVDVELTILTDSYVTGNLVAHIVIIERAILFESAPGSNGEKDFFNIMKKMLPSANGTDIADEWYGGDNIIINESWDLSNVYNPSEIAVVAFIQDNTTQEVLQAVYSAPYPVYDTDIMNVSSNVTGSSNPYLCDGSASPEVTIRNIGADDLTSCTVEYAVNGGATSSYDWAGSLSYGEQATISLPSVSFTLEAENTLEVTISNPNGGYDGFDGNNESTSIAFGSPEAPTNTVHLKIRTDQYGSETTWEIVDESDDVIEDGGPYSGQNNTVVYDEDIELPAVGCYTFKIYDAYGDGICCAYGSGYYEITDINDVMLIEGGEFTSEANASLKTLSVVNINQTDLLNSMTLYPNPVSNTLTVQTVSDQTMQLTVTVYDMLGRVVMEAMNGMTNESIIIPVTGLADGMYTLSISGEGVLQNSTFHVVR
jgi:hypothetical protein